MTILPAVRPRKCHPECHSSDHQVLSSRCLPTSLAARPRPAHLSRAVTPGWNTLSRDHTQRRLTRERTTSASTTQTRYHSSAARSSVSAPVSQVWARAASSGPAAT